ncbi:calcium/sodium antiporter [Pseudomarimonas arenosa]|uniref:Calcium/sodium antiporter n=1 Tax=Pseudomarimonas arenosa TaxID=2774145 RepID=A0AAW3ZN25_9GAMM|nr:calcium/sodium antiporter [Pseudomarimonas arenosa]MBD8525776.1 calcium/sodium antiporter [Pseudomarimonas arenosa]
MFEALLWFGLGIVILLLGADSFLKGASGLALRFGISPFVVGLTIVGFGTSAPELAVNLSAVWRDSTELALGNVVGSNIANVGLILGCCALVAPLAVQLRMVRVEGPLMIGAALLLWVLCFDGELGRGDALLLLIGFAAVMTYVARTAGDESAEVQAEFGEHAGTQLKPPRNVVRLIVGLAALVYGASEMVDAALILARLWGWSDLLIGLTVVAVGTSLPELASSLLAVWRGQTDIAVGNVVGSNLFNILLILGATASIEPLPVTGSMLRLELPIMCGFMVLAYLVMGRKMRITRAEGGLMLLAFVGCTTWLALR